MIRFKQGKLTTNDIHKFKNFDLLLTAYRYRKAAEEDYKQFRKSMTWTFAFILIFAFLLTYQVSHLKWSSKDKNAAAMQQPEGGSFEKKQDPNAIYSSFEIDASSASIITLLSGTRVYVPAYAFRYHNKMVVEGRVEILFLEYDSDKLSYEIYAFSNGAPVLIKEKIITEHAK